MYSDSGAATCKAADEKCLNTDKSSLTIFITPLKIHDLLSD